MSNTTETRKNAIKSWADSFIQSLAQNKSAIEFDPEAAMITIAMTLQEDEVQVAYETGNDPGLDQEPLLMATLINKLNVLKVPRTRSAEIIASLGINTRREAIMMAAVLKRVYEIQSPKPEKLTAGHVGCLLSGGTIREDFNNRMWSLQKGVCSENCCDNLLDSIIPSDFEN